MAKLRVLSGKDVCKILAEQGFSEVRRKGSHSLCKNQRVIQQSLFLLRSVESKIGTLLEIIKQSGLSRTLFVI